MSAEREIQLARREGYTACFNDWSASLENLHPAMALRLGGEIEDVAAAKFPLPTISVPRIVRDPLGEGWWRAEPATGYLRREDAPLVMHLCHTGQRPAPSDPSWTDDISGVTVTKERAELFLDLLERPTDTIEEPE